MPGGDGTGPTGQGSRTGRGRGGQGRGMGGGTGMGPGGECVCQKCGHRIPHQLGVQCFDVKCPKCGGAMTRG